MTETDAKERCKALLHSDKAYNGLTNTDFWKDGYEQGYEDGKPKWHDLREDPNDLPKLEDKRFSWSITVANQSGEACHYNYKRARWETTLFTEIKGVIAWCELLKFEE